MSGGTGRYTQYAAPASAKNDLLNKLYKSTDPVNAPPTQDLVGKETDARLLLVSMGNTFLTPVHTSGDPGHFPSGVDLNFAGAPDVPAVKWTNPGDPANPYAPDISSPGPGHTEGTDKATDPQVSIADLKPNYVQGGPNTGTRSPGLTNGQIYGANTLGVPGTLGNSGGNV